MNILFVNACVRKESRTRILAERVLSMLDGTVTEVNPAAETKPIEPEQGIGNGGVSGPGLCPCAPVCTGGSHCDRGTVLGSFVPCCSEGVF